MSLEPRWMLAAAIFEAVQTQNDNANFISIDVNGDGDLDLATVGSRRVEVLENEGGHFSKRSSTVLDTEITGDSVFRVAFSAADFDQDGDQDLLTNSGWIENTDGKGAFTTVHFTPSTWPFDFDHDGDLDLLASGSYQSYPAGGPRSSWTWYENDGHGPYSLAHPVYIPVGRLLSPVDWDNDQDTDLLMLRSDHTLVAYFNPGTLGTDWIEHEILQGVNVPWEHFVQAGNSRDNGLVDVIAELAAELVVVQDIHWSNGQWDMHIQRLPWPATSRVLNVADLNHDHLIDLIVDSNGDLGWLPQKSAGQFGPFAAIDTLKLSQPQIIAADFDGDADTDLLLQDARQRTVRWYENKDGSFDVESVVDEGTGTRRFVSQAKHDIAEYVRINDVQLVDWSGDGLADLIEEARQRYDDSDATLRWRENLGGSFGDPRTLVEFHNTSAGSWHLADVDGDRALDLVAVMDTHVMLYRWLADKETFVLTTLFSSPSIREIKGVDVDGDSDLDLILRDRQSDYPYTESLLWSENIDGKGAFAPPTILMGPDNARALIWNELDRNGSREWITVKNRINGAIIQFWEYDPAARALRNTKSLATGPYEMVFGDFNGDAQTDVVQTLMGNVWIHFATPEGEWTDRQLTYQGSDGSGLSDPVATDVDFDGDLDLLMVQNGSPNDKWFENRWPEGLWVQHDLSLELTNSSAVTVGDIDGDQDPDLVVRGPSYDPGVTVWRNVHGQYDWSQDQSIDLADLDALCLAVAGHSDDLKFDLNRDKLGSLTDVSKFLHDVLRGVSGDVDDDSRFTSSDLIRLMQRGQYERHTIDARWSEGDFDCNGRFDSSDLQYLLAHADYKPATLDENLDSVVMSETIVFNQFDDEAPALEKRPLLEADIDQDGDDDLMFYRTWYRNDGPSQPFVSHAVLEQAFSDVGDIDTDGDPDGLVVGRDAGQESYWVENVDGHGRFETQHSLGFMRWSRDSTPRFVDWDGDGDLDLIAVRDEFSLDTTASVVVYENQGRGSLREAIVVVTRSGDTRIGAQSFDLADLDRDGWVDIAVSGDAWFRNLRGSFAQVQRMPIGPLPIVEQPPWITPSRALFTSILAGDLDHDGDVDLIQADATRNMTFSYNDGAGQWTHVLSNFRGTTFYLSDADHDGHWELWLEESRRWAEAKDGWTDLSTAGFSDFSFPKEFPAIPPVFRELDGDGRDGLLVANDGELIFLDHQSPDDLTFSEERRWPGARDIDEVRVNDFDQDGRTDIAVSFYYTQPVWFRNLGNDQWSEPIALESGLWDLADFDFWLDVDQDGDLDRTSNVAWRENQPGVAPTAWPEHRLPAKAIAWWDRDRDGDLDLVGENLWWPTDRGQFASYYVEGRWIRDLADLNADANVEMLTASLDIVSSEGKVLDSIADLTSVFPSDHSFMFFDMDHDGDLDITNVGQQWVENRDGRFDKLHPRTTRGHSWVIDHAFGDFDNDGLKEMVVAWGGHNDVAIVRPSRKTT